MFSEAAKAFDKLANSIDGVQQPDSKLEQISSRLKVQEPLCTFQASYGVFDPFEKMEFEGMAPHDSEQVEMISEFLNGMDELNPFFWSELSIEQRTDVLNSIDEKIACITKRTPCRVEAAALEDNLNGLALPDGRICINKRLLEDCSREGISKCLETLLHEGRHAYQNYNLNVRAVEQNSERIESWRLNHEMGYEDGECSFFDYKKMGFKRYLTQPVETDARVFAESILDRLDL